MDDNDLRWMQRAIAVARSARDKGNHPFGAVLVDEHGFLLMEAENTVVTDNDCTAHAEANLIRQAAKTYDRDFLGKCTIYSSTEPCPMCAGAIFWGNVRRVVFGLSEERFYEQFAHDEDEVLYLPCREVFARGRKAIQVVGPSLEEEALVVHEGFWD
jgi:tRNA(Arg) A34 adenosine deaminase TadA